MIGLKALTILLLLLLPLGELLRFNIGNNIYLKPLDITTGLLAVWFVIWLMITKKYQKPFNWMLLLFPLIGLVSLIINSLWLHGVSWFVAFLYLVRWVSYVSILFIVPYFDDAFKKKLGFFLLIDGIVFVFIGYLQYFFYSDIRNLVSIGWDDHMYRLFSTFYDPNFAGAFLVLFALYVAGCIVNQLKAKKKKDVYILSIVLFFTLGAILLTFSRSALIMIVAGGSTLLILLKQKRLILLGIVALILYVIAISPRFYIENTNLFRVASTGARLETYSNAFQIYQNNPILGVGFNSYRYAQQLYGFRSETPKYPSNADAGVDNSFLFVLATTGVVGFSAFLLMWAFLLQNVIIIFKKERNVFAAVFISSTIGLFINAFFINSLFFSAIVLWMWLLYGLLGHRK